MRVIEPRHMPAPKQPRKKLSRLQKFILAGAVFVLILGFVAWWGDGHPESSVTSLIEKVARTEDKQVKEAPKTTIQNFSAEAFKDLYNTFAYPNTQEITEPPAITGNPEADQRIQELAEARGYALRSVPVSPISKTNEPQLDSDDLLQPLALSGWQDFELAAQRAGIPLKLLSGYRSVEYQRDLFTQRLAAAGAYTADIANGIADAKVQKVLATTAPPGYSRHHTGYTIDLSCHPGGQFVVFKTSACFDWIKAENYKIAKRYGWIPSYPDGTDTQGPEPEPWEYVWVGVESLKN